MATGTRRANPAHPNSINRNLFTIAKEAIVEKFFPPQVTPLEQIQSINKLIVDEARKIKQVDSHIALIVKQIGIARDEEAIVQLVKAKREREREKREMQGLYDTLCRERASLLTVERHKQSYDTLSKTNKILEREAAALTDDQFKDAHDNMSFNLDELNERSEILMQGVDSRKDDEDAAIREDVDAIMVRRTEEQMLQAERVGDKLPSYRHTNNARGAAGYQVELLEGGGGGSRRGGGGGGNRRPPPSNPQPPILAERLPSVSLTPLPTTRMVTMSSTTDSSSSETKPKKKKKKKAAEAASSSSSSSSSRRTKRVSPDSYLAMLQQ